MGRAWGDLCTPCPPRGSTEWSHLCGGGVIPPDWRRNVTGGGGGGSGGENGIGGGGYEPPAIAKINECMLRNGICGLGDCIDKDIGYQCQCWDGAEAAEIDGNPTCATNELDIDECALEYCKGGTCINRPGGFDCRCPPGFDPVENGLRCSDKNECDMTNGQMCTNGVCTYLGGTWECVCNPGYSSSASGHSCVDVDECRDVPRVCRRGRCRNAPGGYDCDCEPGFALSAGGYCSDVDECSDDTVCQGGRCVNVEGSFQCVCEAGYRGTAGRGACVDVDECAEQRVCRNGRCHNSAGSFRCECLPGFTLTSDGRTCVDEVQDLCYEKYEEGHCTGPGQNPVTRSQCCCSSAKGMKLGWGVSCRACPAEGSPERAVLCPEGGGKDNGGADINECTAVPGACPHGSCENLEPGYRCICDPGYRAGAAGLCEDIDECDMHQSYCSGGQCRNTQGSYVCVCPPGTRLEADAQLCRDVDECAGETSPRRVLHVTRGDIPLSIPVDAELANPCDNGRCINTHGSYECECEHGFVLDPTAQHCLDNRRGSCWRRAVDGQCEGAAPLPLLRQECCCSVGLAWGSPCEPCDPDHCPCPKGFAKVDGASCRDVDECTLDPELCVGGACVNTDGSYRCECPPGLTLDAAGGRCVDTRREYCYTGYAGGRCGGPLPLAVHRAVCCCSALGRAWGDARCEPCPKKGTDAYRNLCISDATINPPGVWDRPLDGGFTCHCRAGHRADHFTNVCVDIDECVETPTLCRGGRCVNTQGSFRCECGFGMELAPDGLSCTSLTSDIPRIAL